jgi:hypothetical protein
MSFSPDYLIFRAFPAFAGGFLSLEQNQSPCVLFNSCEVAAP